MCISSNCFVSVICLPDGCVWGEILIKGFIIIYLSWIERSLKQEVAYNLLFKTSNFIISHMNRSISHHLPFEFQNLLWTEVMYPILDASYFGVNSLLLCHLGANKREAIPVCPHLASDFDFYNRVFIVDVVPIPLSHHQSPCPQISFRLLTGYSLPEICKRKTKRKYLHV